MTAQFHEGQDVEVQYDDGEGGQRDIIWRKAKIVVIAPLWGNKIRWLVQFTDGTRGVFDSEHIRSVDLDVPEIIMVPR